MSAENHNVSTPCGTSYSEVGIRFINVKNNLHVDQSEFSAFALLPAVQSVPCSPGSGVRGQRSEVKGPGSEG
ncbi:hypothetical protein EYF80_065969 [Liparis tanakae]|uniref:Uncharacterized protein n=1 Tax=Liparis tanakae TaxID=230148 RepID=A0A4Z2E5P2_9TELE|nr:hypothetical protein EYF80_065969 [Liparis tanakae]